MSRAAATFAPSFQSRRPVPAAPRAAVALPSCLVELARKADSAGCLRATDFLVGAALRPIRRAVAKLQGSLADIDLGNGLPQA